MSADPQRVLPFAAPPSPAVLTREAAQAILEALRAASWCEAERGPVPSPTPLIVESCRAGVCVAWWGLRAEGRDEHEVLAAFVRRQVASAQGWAASRRREAQRLRDAAKQAPVLDAQAARIEAALARLAADIPDEPKLDGFDDDTADAP